MQPISSAIDIDCMYPLSLFGSGANLSCMSQKSGWEFAIANPQSSYFSFYERIKVFSQLPVKMSLHLLCKDFVFERNYFPGGS